MFVFPEVIRAIYKVLQVWYILGFLSWKINGIVKDKWEKERTKLTYDLNTLL